MFSLMAAMFYKLGSDPLEAIDFQWWDPEPWNQFMAWQPLSADADRCRHGSSAQPAQPSLQPWRDPPDRHTGRQGTHTQGHTAHRSSVPFTENSSHTTQFPNPRLRVRKWAGFAHPKFKYSSRDKRPWHEIRISLGVHHTEEQSHSQWFLIKINI